MNEVLQFLTENPTFYIATTEGNQPKIRPFGFVMEFEGKLYFATNKTKEVYKQLQANPKFEICTTAKDNSWIRFSGIAVMDDRLEAREKAFATAPFFSQLYKTPDNPIFTLFYATEGQAVICNMSGETKTIVL